jgi:predicted secreted hydrolase
MNNLRMNNLRWLLLLVTGLTLAALAASVWWGGRGTAPPTASATITDALAGDLTGYTRATAPRPFFFPQDHGPHPGFKLEWWYLTGNLATPDGRRFGYQFTVFRSALAPPDTNAPPPASAWTTRQLYLAHLGLTDADGRRFHSHERFARGAAGLAGAETTPFRLWVEDWTLASTPPDRLFPLHLQLTQDDLALDLALSSRKPIVLQGEAGFSRKGTDGQASYYYSMTRLATTGTLTVDGHPYTVTGHSWLDREWSTSLLSRTQTGWDWFSLQLDDGRDLMFFQLRERDPGQPPYTDGTLVSPAGSAERLASGMVQITPVRQWTSPHSGVTYPVAWRMQLPSRQLDLTLTPLLDDQEHHTSVRYWEGALRISGTDHGRPITGYGYLEMTGYGEDRR